MKRIAFGQWAEMLARTDLPERRKESWAILLKWYLGFCRRSRAGVNVQSARDFIEWAQKEKQPQPWQVEGWKEAIRWFFRAAKAAAAGRPAEPVTNPDESGPRRRGIQHRSPRRSGAQAGASRLTHSAAGR